MFLNRRITGAHLYYLSIYLLERTFSFLEPPRQVYTEQLERLITSRERDLTVRINLMV